MRTRLKQLRGKRHKFLAYVQGFAVKNPNRICIENVRLPQTGELVADHVWVHGKWISEHALRVGDIIKFTACVQRYVKVKCIPDLRVHDMGLFQIKNVQKI